MNAYLGIIMASVYLAKHAIVLTFSDGYGNDFSRACFDRIFQNHVKFAVLK